MFPSLKLNLLRTLTAKAVAVGILLGVLASPVSAAAASWWEVQSVDTMKVSRDMAQEKLNDSSFDAVIDRQVDQIAKMGATHVAIGTPYDEKFVPFMRRWVASARKHGISVWFRGNWSGWEGWFNTPRIGREDHTKKTVGFIKLHPELFRDGDIFTSCPECENGGPGDPRHTGDITGHRQFLIKEHVAVSDAFDAIKKDVTSNYYSMNGDVARAIMDKPTTQALGGVIAIDHYVAQPVKLAEDIVELTESSGGKVILSEFGAPIPDIHGNLSAKQQAQWIDEALTRLKPLKNFIGVNYWVGYGGSTALWEDNGQARPVVAVVKKHFIPPRVKGIAVAADGSPARSVTVTSDEGKEAVTDKDGSFSIPYASKILSLHISGEQYKPAIVNLTPSDEVLTIQLDPVETGWWKTLIQDVVSFLIFWR